MVNKLVNDLIKQDILPQQLLQRHKSLYRHEPGSISVSPGWIKVIVPALVDEGCQVSIDGSKVEKQNVNWDCRIGIILGKGVRLSTPRTIFYYSVSIPISHAE